MAWRLQLRIHPSLMVTSVSGESACSQSWNVSRVTWKRCYCYRTVSKLNANTKY